MGIERFFSSIKRDFDVTINTEYPYKKIHANYLMIDFNSIVHVISAHMINTINTFIKTRKKNCPYSYDNVNSFENNLLKVI